MNDSKLHPEALKLQKELEQLLETLKHNRDKVPLAVLKTKYKTGYDNLCRKINTTATAYIKQILFYSVRIHKDYIDICIPVIEQAIKDSGLLKQLSNAAYSKQDISEFTNLAFALKQLILEALQPVYKANTTLLCTPECMENPSVPLVPYCLVNNCILRDGKWVPFESCSTFMYKQLENMYLAITA